MKILKELTIGFIIGMICMNLSLIVSEKKLTSVHTVTFTDSYGKVLDVKEYKCGDKIVYPDFNQDKYYFFEWRLNAPKTMPDHDLLISAESVLLSDLCYFNEGEITGLKVYKNTIIIPTYYINEQGQRVNIHTISHDSHFYDKNTTVKFLGTIEDWCNITFTTAEANPMFHYYDVYMYVESGGLGVLTDVYIPKSITEIKNYQFINNNRIDSIIFSDSVKVIGEKAFSGCSDLKKVTFTTGTTTFKKDAFMNTSNLKDVYFTGNASDWLNLDFESFESSPMSSGEVLYFLNANGIFEQVEEIEVPDHFTSIKPFTLTSINNLKKLVIGNKIQKFEESFYGSDSLKEFYYKGTLSDWCRVEISSPENSPMSFAEEFYCWNESGEKELITNLVIPSDITTINSYQFYGFKQLEEIHIGSSVKTINYRALANCDKIEKVYISSSVETIKTHVFSFTTVGDVYCESQSRPAGWLIDWNTIATNVTWDYQEE